jgi:predicted ATPase/DNA-binding SARP family transcriptional activator
LAVVEVRVLGPLDVRHDGDSVAIRRGHPRALLTLLALHSPDVVPADVLIDRLWGEDLPANPSNALQLQVSYLRRVLATIPGGAEVLRTERDGYRLALEPDDLDLRRFERLATEARGMEAAPGARLAIADEALQLWRGDPLPEIASHPAVAGDLTRIGELYLATAELHVDALVELGRSAEAIAALGPLLGRFPLHERFHAQLMVSLYRSGRQTDALRAFQEIRGQLAEELGLDVGPELAELEARILAHDPTLGSPVPAPGSLRPVPLQPVEPSAPRTSLIGRDDTVARVVELLGDRRLVTLTGPGGAGKTRVAVEAIRRLAASSVAVFFVDLGSVTSDDVVARSVAEALHVATSLEEDVATSVLGALAPLAGIVVLDTCEHLVDQVAPLVDALLTAAPGITVLATSRRPLGVAGELAWPVAPLSLPVEEAHSNVGDAQTSAAVRLFCERASAVRPDFTLDTTNVADVIAICHAVDGLPLAIELAAAHADVLSPAAIRSRLGGRFELLRGHGAAGPERHRALRATIDWSVDLLQAPERTLLAQLSVFAGSFDLEAAAAVAGVADVLPLLAPLVRHSLVTVVADDRYRLLDSVRAHAAIAGGRDLDQERVIADRHAAFFRIRARAADRAIRGSAQVEVVTAMEQDLPNYRVALQWAFDRVDGDAGADLASSLAWMWAVHGNTAEADHWLRRALAREDLSERARIRALLAASMVAAPAGELARSLALSEEASVRAEAAALPVHQATALLNAGVAHWATGRYATSVAQLERALLLFQQTDRPRGVALTTMNLGRSVLDLGDVDRAGDLLAEAAALMEGGGDPQLRSLVTYQQARRALLLGQLETATSLASRSLTQAEALAHHETIAASLHVLGGARLAAGDVRGARDCHRRALAVAVSTNHVGAAVEAVEALGEVASVDGDASLAGNLLAAAAAERARRGLPVPGGDADRLAAVRAGLPTPAVPPAFRDVLDELLLDSIGT